VIVVVAQLLHPLGHNAALQTLNEQVPANVNETIKRSTKVLRTILKALIFQIFYSAIFIAVSIGKLEVNWGIRILEVIILVNF
jgi:hypothetical protein